MRLRFLGKNSAGGDSPTLYATDRDTYVVQGWKVTDLEILAKLTDADGETCVEIPPALFIHLVEDGLHGVVTRLAPPIVHVTDKDNYIVRGRRVTDIDARKHMAIPDFEDCVEITAADVHTLLKEGNLGVDHE